MKIFSNEFKQDKFPDAVSLLQNIFSHASELLDAELQLKLQINNFPKKLR